MVCEIDQTDHSITLALESFPGPGALKSRRTLRFFGRRKPTLVGSDCWGTPPAIWPQLHGIG